MVSFDVEYLRKLSPKLFDELTSVDFESIRSKISSRNQGFLEMLDDEDNVKRIQSFAKSQKKWEHIIILGIGGSALGPACLYDTFHMLYSMPKCTVLDTIDPIFLDHEFNKLELNKTLFIVISKSGTTPETVAQYAYIKEKLGKNTDALIIITGSTGYLRDESIKNNIPCFDIPENVGGRFSVLSSVGLLPAALLGIDIKQLIEGAKLMRQNYQLETVEKNLPFLLAHIWNTFSMDLVFFPYANSLQKFADWNKQLIAESLGKEGKGLTPITALGATDQHSQLQLFSEGPNNKLYMFFDVKHLEKDLSIPTIEDKNLSYLSDITFGELLSAELHGTMEALATMKRPLIKISIDTLSPQELGSLFVLFECTVAILAEIWNIDAFNQPGVELSKRVTKDILCKK